MTDSQVLALEREAEKLRQAGEFSAAVEKINAALALDPNFVRGHLSLAVLYHNLQNYELSCRHGEIACELEPNDSFNYAALSVTYHRAFEGTRDRGYIEKAEMAMARSRAAH